MIPFLTHCAEPLEASHSQTVVQHRLKQLVTIENYTVNQNEKSKCTIPCSLHTLWRQSGSQKMALHTLYKEYDQSLMTRLGHLKPHIDKNTQLHQVL